MRHSTQTATEHIVTFTDEDAEALGATLLAIVDHDAALPIDVTDTKGWELMLQLANHLNGVE